MFYKRRIYSLLIFSLLAGLTACSSINLPFINKTSSASNVLKASGSFTTVRIRLAAEIAGKIVEEPVQKGEKVNAGEVVFRLDDELLKVQRDQMQAAITAGETDLLNAQRALKDLKDNADVAAAQAQFTLAKAKSALDDAQKKQVSLTYDRATSDNIETVRAQYNLAQKAVDAAQKLYDNLSSRPEKDQLRSQATVNLNAAKKRRDTIKSNLDWLLGFPTDLQVGEREASLALAQAQVDKAQRDYDNRKNGPNPDDLAQAEARVKSSQAQLDRAKSALQEIEIRLGKVTVAAPSSGVVLDVPLNVGEMAAAGATVVEIGNLEKLTLTVYIPEDQYGHIRLGQSVNVTVDSFPGKTFKGVVSYISDQAEFTPRNVQTVETRSTTVYAVEISLENPDQFLKPGMPADAEFVP